MAGSIVASFVEQQLEHKSAVLVTDVKAGLRGKGISASDENFEDAVKILKSKGIILESFGSQPRMRFVQKT